MGQPVGVTRTVLVMVVGEGVTMTVLVMVVGEGVTMTVLIMVVGEGVTVVVVVVTVLIPTEGVVEIVGLVSTMLPIEEKERHTSMRLATSTSGLDMMWTTPDAVGISCLMMPLSSPRVIRPS